MFGGLDVPTGNNYDGGILAIGQISQFQQPRAAAGDDGRRTVDPS